MSLKELEAVFEAEVSKISSAEELMRLKAAFLGKKGHLSIFLKGLGDLPVETRPLYGSQANELKKKIDEACRQLLESFECKKKDRILREESVDVTLPGREVAPGGIHPLTRVLEEVETIFREIGFSVYGGPEIETDYFNFEALNIPKHHPARDMQDTFYIGGITAPSASGGRGPHPPKPLGSARSKSDASPSLLRTHTSPVQIHVMKRMRPPIRMIAPGAVYRRDSDISHTPMFHQVEGLSVGEGIRFSDLKGVVSYFLHRLFDESLKVRFRASYFPFTEPSAEVDIQCVVCRGKGTLANVGRSQSCRLCKTTGWLEVIGCGMVHPAVFENVGYDPKEVTGFAFGMGIERLTMLKYGIPDIRLFFENDLRFLRQF